MANNKDNIKNYAIAYISFDEETRDVYDSKNGYRLGVVYNNPPRVQGWNGKGYSISLNGNNQYIQMNNKIVPIGAKSIRFKIKTTQQSTAILLSQTAGTAYNGAQINIQDGYLYFVLGKSTSGDGIFTVKSNKKINDGNWHDILCTWTGDTTIDGVKIFIDDMLIPDTKGTATSEEILSPTYNLRIGASNTTTIMYHFNGQLDDIEIYNRVISILPDKYLIQHNNEYKYHDGTSWVLVEPTEENFILFGMDQLYQITEEQWNELVGDLNVVMYTDNKEKEYISVVLERDEFTAKDVINNNFKIIVNNQSDSNKEDLLLLLDAVPQTIYSNSDISLDGVETIDNITVNGIGEGKIGISVDGGNVWKALANDTWVEIDDLSFGMDFQTLNSLTNEKIQELLEGSVTIRFGYYLNNTTEIDNIIIKVSYVGYPQIANKNDYEVNYYPSTKTLTYTINKNGDYTINYLTP